MRPIFLLLLFHIASHAQPLAREVFATMGHGRLFRLEDNPLGGGPNLGAGFGLTHRSGLGVDFAVNRMLGLSASPAPCGVVNLPCEGSARQGVTGAATLSADLRYEFTRARVRPYAIGGVGALRSHGFSPAVYVSGQRAVLSEEKWADTGLAINFGAGLRIRLARSLSLRPELRLYSATALSRANLSLFRPSLALAWAW